jgi:hypothetical protein
MEGNIAVCMFRRDQPKLSWRVHVGTQARLVPSDCREVLGLSRDRISYIRNLLDLALRLFVIDTARVREQRVSTASVCAPAGSPLSLRMHSSRPPS